MLQIYFIRYNLDITEVSRNEYLSLLRKSVIQIRLVYNKFPL